MRYVYGTLVILITLAVVIFQIQNLSSVTVQFLQMTATLPLGLVVLGAYALGMTTGGFFASLVRQWIARMQQQQPPPPGGSLT